jgi:hypothetical protein
MRVDTADDEWDVVVEVEGDSKSTRERVARIVR